MGGELGVFTAYVFFGVLVLSAGLILWMMVSLVHSEVADERRRLIVGKACTWTLIATVGAQIIELVRTAAAQPNGEPTSPFISLAVIAILYAVFLGWFRHKYGG